MPKNKFNLLRLGSFALMEGENARFPSRIGDAKDVFPYE